MEYTHGKPLLGIEIKAANLEDYKKSAAEYIRGECSLGKVSFRIDTDKNWTVAGPYGRVLDIKSPMAAGQARYVHKVEVVHEWELPPKGQGAKPTHGRDIHVFYFDVTRAVPPDLAKRLRQKAGIKT